MRNLSDMSDAPTVHITAFRYGSRIFARAFSTITRANGYALRVKTVLGVTATVTTTRVDAYDPGAGTPDVFNDGNRSDIV